MASLVLFGLRDISFFRGSIRVFYRAAATEDINNPNLTCKRKYFSRDSMIFQYRKRFLRYTFICLFDISPNNVSF